MAQHPGTTTPAHPQPAGDSPDPAVGTGRADGTRDGAEAARDDGFAETAETTGETSDQATAEQGTTDQPTADQAGAGQTAAEATADQAGVGGMSDDVPVDPPEPSDKPRPEPRGTGGGSGTAAVRVESDGGSAGRLSPSDREQADAVLAALAGLGAQLRPDQERAIAALMQPAARVLVVQATGWGKSAVYWVTTALRRARGSGPALVVSPLLALMRDQIAAAQRAGLRARTINSSNVGEWTAIEAELQDDEVDILLVSPERLAHPGFGRRVLDALRDRLGLLVVDEAHAISDWGHDFRPDYRRVADVLRDLCPQTPVLATTATANARVTADVAAQLGEATLVLRGPLSRSSLELVVVPDLAPIERYTWVVEHLPRLPGHGIVYALTIADTKRLVAAIRAVHGPDAPIAAYHGRLPAEEREALEDALRENRLKALIATSALGMGYDKPDLGFVVHVGAPPSPVSYYQQVGRAGRAIDRALVVLLPSSADAGVWEYFATATLPDPRLCERLLEALAGESGPVSAPQLEALTGIRRTRVDLMLKQLAVDGVVDRVFDGWRATGTPWVYDAEHYAGILAGRRREAAIMTRYVAGQSCLMHLLQESLDDEGAAACGRCSVCRGGLPEALRTEVDRDILGRVTAALRSRHAVLEPRKMWPGGVFGLRGRIPAGLLAAEGRVLIHADAPEWQDVLAVIHGTLTPGAGAGAGAGVVELESRARAAENGATEGPVAATPPGVPAELLHAAVDALVSWRPHWPARPEVVVDFAAHGLPVAAAVADHVAAVGRLDRAHLPVNIAIEEDGASGSGPAEAAAWRSALTISSPLAQAIRGRCVLLVVDLTSSGWSLTIATAALREAGAEEVLPLLVHQGVGPALSARPN